MKFRSISNKWNSLSAPTKASLALMVTQFIQKGLQVISAPIYTRLLTSEQYGQVAVFFSWYEILVIFTGLCLSRGVFNNGMQDFKEDRKVFTLSLYFLTVLSTILVGSCVTIICKYIRNFIGLHLDIIEFMFILLAFESSLSMWTVEQRFEYKWKASTIISAVIAIVSPIVSILCIILLPYDRVHSRIIGERLIFLLAYFMIIIHIIREANFKINTRYWKYALLFNLPLIPHYLSLFILNHTDQIMISRMIGNSATGIYSVAYNGSSAIKLFWTSINASLIPWTYEKCEQRNFRRIKEVTEVLLLSFAFICIIFMLFAPEVMEILSPSEYHEGIYVIPPVVAGIFFSVMYYIFANVIYYYKKPKYVMIGSIISALLNLILNYIFIPIFGYIAAGYTTMFSYIFQTIMDYWAMRKTVEENIYDTRFLLLISIVVVFSGTMLSFIYAQFLLRMILTAGAIALFLIYLSRNKEIFNQFFRHKSNK